MSNKNALIKTFFELVRIDSPSGREQAVAAYIVNYLKKIQIRADLDKYGNVLARVPGAGAPLLLNAHMDTVQPGEGIVPVLGKDVITSEGDTILAADDKAGLAVILETVKDLREAGAKHRALELVFTREEETGCLGAMNLDYKQIKAKEGLVLDSSRPLGHICLAAPFIYMLDIEVRGKAAHGGAFPEKGRNALVMAARAIADIRLGRLSASTTANLGLISGGSASNTVPDLVRIKGDVRSHRLETAQREVDKISQTFKKQARRLKGSLKFKSVLAIHGYSYDRRDPFVQELAGFNKRMGFKTVYERSGGATDANVFAGRGLKVLDISYGGKYPHTVKETIKASELVKLARFLSEFVRHSA